MKGTFCILHISHQSHISSIMKKSQHTDLKSMLPSDVDYVIYHDPCVDGTGSGYVAWSYLSSRFPTRDVIYCAAQIGAAIPDNIDGRNVLICDYSYKKHVIVELLKRVNKLLIIDHHKSAEKELSDIDEQYKIFDMNHSGAMLTWMYFYPTIDAPMLIKYIEDRDIWTKKLYKTEEFTAWFYTLPHEFQEYHKYIDDTLLMKMIEEKGTSFVELNEYNISESVSYAAPKFMKIKDSYYFVAYVNSTTLKSDIGNKIFTQYPYIDFSVVYSINDWDNSSSFSLRSTDKHVDTSVISTSLGGGGHRNASGAKSSYVTNTLPGTVYDIGGLYSRLGEIYTDTLVIGTTSYNVVYYPSTLHSKKLATWLLQIKYDDIQECQAIIMHRDGTINYNAYHIAIGVSYNPRENYTHFTVVFCKTITEDTKKHIYKWFTVSDLHTGIRYTGCHSTIPQDKTLVIKKPIVEDNLFMQ